MSGIRTLRGYSSLSWAKHLLNLIRFTCPEHFWKSATYWTLMKVFVHYLKFFDGWLGENISAIFLLAKYCYDKTVTISNDGYKKPAKLTAFGIWLFVCQATAFLITVQIDLCRVYMQIHFSMCGYVIIIIIFFFL